MVNIDLISHAIPRSEKMELKSLYVCLECSNHTYSNNIINRNNVRLNRVPISYKMTRGSEKKGLHYCSGNSKHSTSLHWHCPMERPA
jgi:hypothetical protein